MNVLVVEQHEPLARLYQEELEEAGYRVKVLANLEDALAFLRQGPVDVLVAGEPAVDSRDWLPNLRNIYNGPVMILTNRLESPWRRGNVSLLPKSHDLGPMLRTLRGQALGSWWSRNSGGIC